MNELESIGRKMPYALSEEHLQGLQERILDRTVRAEQAAPVVRWRRLCIAGAGFVLLTGAILGVCLLRRPQPSADLDTLLRSAPDETLRQAAAQNYDDILYDQQV